MARTNRGHESNKGPRSSKRPSHGRNRDSHEPDLVADVRRAVRDPNPLSLLDYVSTLLFVTDPRRQHPFARPAAPEFESPSRDDLVGRFIDVPAPETSALLAVIAGLVGDDELLRARIRRELAARPRVEPAWAAQLCDAETYRAVRMSHILGDGDNVMLGTRLPGGREFTSIVYIDHNMGTLVKDAFAIPESIDSIVAGYQAVTEDPDIRWDDIELADARACVEAAIELAAITFPPFESETWPGCKALVEWITRGLPEGGSGYHRPQWTAGQLAEVADRFFTSSEGAQLSERDHRELLDSILWFGTNVGPGNPLRWSPVRVELLLVDWIPRKLVAPAEDLALVPDLLRAFIRFAHRSLRLRPVLTDEALTAVDSWEPAYRETIRAPRVQSPEAILASLGVGGDDVGDGSLEPGYDNRDIKRWVLDRLARDVGGLAALARLDDEPLPDEPFDWVGIPDDIADPVRDVLVLVDNCCGAMFDVEVRTGCRRLLARFASMGPEAFRRKARAENSAAAVVWMIGKVNEVFNIYHSGKQVKDVMSHFGLKGSASQRAGAMLETAGFDSRTHDLSLGSPDYLVAARRREMIEVRDQYRDLADDAIDLDR
jgi:hypothetical protein